MIEILHISDLHFGPPFRPDRAAGVHELARRRQPDAVVVSGDFTQRARRTQFQAAREYLDGFATPVIVTPGNHDLPLYRLAERFFAPRRNYREFISEELDTVHRMDGATIVALDSTRRLALTSGRLSERQLRFAGDAFASAPVDDLRVVVTHHHLAPPPDLGGGEVMAGARRALEAFTGFGVHLLLAGHMHRSYIGDSLDFFPGRDREKGMVVVQCGTTTSARGRGRERLKNSLNVIRTDERETRITHYLWRDAEGRFRPHSEHRFGSRRVVWLDALPLGGRAAAESGADDRDAAGMDAADPGTAETSAGEARTRVEELT